MTDTGPERSTGVSTRQRWIRPWFGAVLAVVAGWSVFGAVAISEQLLSAYVFKHSHPLVSAALALIATGVLTGLTMNLISPLRPWLAVATVVVLEAALAGGFVATAVARGHPPFFSLLFGALSGLVLGVAVVRSMRGAKTRGMRLRALLLAGAAYLMVMALADLGGWAYLGSIQRPSRAAVEQWLSAEVLAKPDEVRWHPHWDFSWNTRRFSLILDGTTMRSGVEVDVETPADKSLVRRRGGRTILFVRANGITVSLPQPRELSPEQAQDPRVLREALLGAGVKPELVDGFDFRSKGPADKRSFIWDLPYHFRAQSHGMHYELLGNNTIPSDDPQEAHGPVISLQCSGEWLLPER